MSLVPLQSGLWFVCGLIAGALYFCGLWWNVRLFAEHRGALVNLVLLLGRIAGLTGVLILATHYGALPLLLSSSGIFAARFAVMRGTRVAAP